MVTDYERWLRDTTALLGGEVAENSEEAGEAEDRLGATPSSGARRSQADVLLAAAADAELFHDPDRTGYARVAFNGRRRTCAVRSADFRDWLIRQYRTVSSGAPSSQAMETALRALEAQACLDGAEREVFVRVARAGATVYLDLCDELGRMVEVTAAGWRVIDEAPVAFKRTRYMTALPEPQRGGDLSQLRAFLNLSESESRWRLLVAWLGFAMLPPGSGTYPVLVLGGQQDSGKSTTARVLRALLDPNRGPLRGEPRESQELMIAARNSWCVAYDNLSRLPEWLSDWLCRLVDGAGLSRRELWTNEDEWLLTAQRPVIINGIGDLAQRGDLLSRALVVELDPLPDERRRGETEFWRDFEAAQPGILGALLDVVAAALAAQAEVRLFRQPRLADFARFGTAAEAHLGWPPGAFLAAYDESRAAGHDIVLGDSSVVPVLRVLLADKGTWEGTASELFEALTALAGEEAARRLPKAPNALSTHLQRIAPSLQAAGIRFERPPRVGRERRRLLRVERLPESSAASSTSPAADDPAR